MRLFQRMQQMVLLGVAVLPVLGSAGEEAIAQSQSACAPPRADEYLLLVLDQSDAAQEQLRQLLPANAVITPCNYLEEEVVRVGGFASVEIANAWAQYLIDMTGLQAFVARPSGTETTSSASAPNPEGEAASFPAPTQRPASGGTSSPVPAPTSGAIAQTTPDSTNPTPSNPSRFPSPTQLPPSATPPSTPTPTAATSSSGQAFNPQPLGAGYAVLVHYFSRPEVAADVHQLTAQPVGLVAYEQRPFLLAAHTNDSREATAILQSLTEQGFTALIVDSRQTVLLTPAVVGTGS